MRAKINDMKRMKTTNCCDMDKIGGGNTKKNSITKPNKMITFGKSNILVTLANPTNREHSGIIQHIGNIKWDSNPKMV